MSEQNSELRVLNELNNDPNVSYSKNHKYLGTFGMVWVAFLIMAVYTASKTFVLFNYEFSVSIIAYPITYIFADIFTEVYGYRVTRKIVWTGFVCLIFTAILGYLYSIVPPSPNFTQNEAFSFIFKAGPILVGSILCSFFCGELTNSFVLAKVKILTKGKYQEFRYILSTFLGQLVDNAIFFTSLYLFTGFFTSTQTTQIIISSVVFCTLTEMFMIPITRKVVEYIKTQEGLDTFDHGTNFNPFTFK